MGRVYGRQNLLHGFPEILLQVSGNDRCVRGDRQFGLRRRPRRYGLEIEFALQRRIFPKVSADPWSSPTSCWTSPSILRTSMPGRSRLRRRAVVNGLFWPSPSSAVFPGAVANAINVPVAASIAPRPRKPMAREFARSFLLNGLSRQELQGTTTTRPSARQQPPGRYRGRWSRSAGHDRTECWRGRAPAHSGRLPRWRGRRSKKNLLPRLPPCGRSCGSTTSWRSGPDRSPDRPRSRDDAWQRRCCRRRSQYWRSRRHIFIFGNADDERNLAALRQSSAVEHQEEHEKANECSHQQGHRTGAPPS